MTKYGANQVFKHFIEELKLSDIEQEEVSVNGNSYNGRTGKSLECSPPNLQLVLSGNHELSNIIKIFANSWEVEYGTLKLPESDPLGVARYFINEMGFPNIAKIDDDIRNIKIKYEQSLNGIEERENERKQGFWRKRFGSSCKTDEYDAEKGSLQKEIYQKIKPEIDKLKQAAKSHYFSRELKQGKLEIEIAFKSYESEKIFDAESLGQFNMRLEGSLTKDSPTTDLIEHPLIEGISNNTKSIEVAMGDIILKGEKEKTGSWQTQYSVYVRKGSGIDSTTMADAEKILFAFS